MSLTEQRFVFEDAPEMTTRRLRAAMRAGDVDALLTTLAPGAVVRSPISSSARIEGHGEIRAVMSAVLAEISGLEYVREVGQGADRALVARARVGRQVIEEAVWLRFDNSGLINEMTLYVRPLAGLTALASRLAGRRGWRYAVAARLMTQPLTAATRAGDAVGLRLAGIRTK